jgi:predicted NBD/HSP70 family sugar kinase
VAARTGLAKATVSNLVDRLIAAGLADGTGPVGQRGPGRPGVGLALSSAGPHGLGVEVAVDYLATCLVDLTGDVRARHVVEGDNRAASVEGVLDRAAGAVRNALAEAASLGVPVGGIGVAVPGLVEAPAGLLRSAPNLGWRDVPVGGELATRLGDDVPIAVGNEADFAACAELWSHPDVRDFVHVSGEIGIGSGIVVDGALFRGVRGFAGEIGHLPVDPGGPACGCGANGCLERMAGLERILADAGIDATAAAPAESLPSLTARIEAGDPRAVAAVESAGRWLGVALSAVVNAIDVPAIVLGGSYAVLAPVLTDALRAELRRRVVSAAWAPPTVLVSELGNEAAVRGAATAATRTILDDPDAYITRVAPGVAAR